jgi:hypothetical protein
LKEEGNVWRKMRSSAVKPGKEKVKRVDFKWRLGLK